MINNPNAQKTSPNNLMPSRIYFSLNREKLSIRGVRGLFQTPTPRDAAWVYSSSAFKNSARLSRRSFAGYFPGSRRIRQLGISRHFRRNTRVEHRSSTFVVDDIADFSILTQRYRNHVVKFHIGSGGDLDGTRQVH